MAAVNQARPSRGTGFFVIREHLNIHREDTKEKLFLGRPKHKKER
jgi:hypothetical protein